MTERLRVNPSVESSRSSEDEIRVDPNSEAWSFVSENLPRRVPLFIPRDQAYYWTREWQDSIRESMTEIKAGEYVIFDDPDDPEDVVRWFLSDED
jgi:hypothetical protein